MLLCRTCWHQSLVSMTELYQKCSVKETDQCLLIFNKRTFRNYDECSVTQNQAVEIMENSCLSKNIADMCRQKKNCKVIYQDTAFFEPMMIARKRDQNAAQWYSFLVWIFLLRVSLTQEILTLSRTQRMLLPQVIWTSNEITTAIGFQWKNIKTNWRFFYFEVFY